MKIIRKGLVKGAVFVLGSWLSLVVNGLWAQFPQEEHPFYLGGIQINEANNSDWVQTLGGIGMNTVEVTVYARQGSWYDYNLWFAEEDQGVINEIRLAKALGLKVTLILRVALDHSFPANKFLWHGMIYPESYYYMEYWFDWYSRFTRKWAKVAEEEGVDVLGIGSELNALASTMPVKKVPNLLSYYMSGIKQSLYLNRILKFTAVRLKFN